MTGLLEGLVALLILAGSFFALVSGIGLLRLPDLFTRMHAATKAGTLGVGLLMVALALDAGDLGVTTKSLAIIAFLLLTAPVAAHVIGRAAYFDGVPLWEGTLRDELRDRYDALTHEAEPDDDAEDESENGAKGEREDEAGARAPRDD